MWILDSKPWNGLYLLKLLIIFLNTRTMLDNLTHPVIPHSCLIPNIKNWLKHLDSIFYITEVTCFSETIFEKALLGNLHLWGLEKRESRDKKARGMIRLAKNLTEKNIETETHREKYNSLWSVERMTNRNNLVWYDFWKKKFSCASKNFCLNMQTSYPPNKKKKSVSPLLYVSFS